MVVPLGLARVVSRTHGTAQHAAVVSGCKFMHDAVQHAAVNSSCAAACMATVAIQSCNVLHL